MKKAILSFIFLIVLFLTNINFTYSLNNSNNMKTIEDDVYKIQSAVSSNIFLAAKNAGTKNETNVQLSSNVDSWQQLWSVKYVENGYYEISTFFASTKMLDIAGAKTKALITQ